MTIRFIALSVLYIAAIASALVANFWHPAFPIGVVLLAVWVRYAWKFVHERDTTTDSPCHRCPLRGHEEEAIAPRMTDISGETGQPIEVLSGDPFDRPKNPHACFGCGESAGGGAEVSARWPNGMITTERICDACEPKYAGYIGGSGEQDE